MLPVDWIGLVAGGFHDSFGHGPVCVGVVVGVVACDDADGAVVECDWLDGVHVFSFCCCEAEPFLCGHDHYNTWSEISQYEKQKMPTSA